MSNIVERKKQHIDIVSNKNIEPSPSSFDSFRLQYSAMPEINLRDIDTKCQFAGYELDAPIIVSSMSGGEKYGRKINENIAKACEKEKIAFGMGSMRVTLKNPETMSTFDVKEFCPSVPMFTNLGMVQLNYGVDLEDIKWIIDEVKADGVFFHLNHLQEAIQPEGDTDYSDLYRKFEDIVKKLKIPFAVKEVGHGIDYSTALNLKELGVEWVDVSGTGGSSWSLIEGYRRLNEGGKMSNDNLGYVFRNEGIPTAEALMELEEIKDLNLIAGGGIRNGLHIAKSIALGASMATLAKPFLHAALDSEEAVVELIKQLKRELRIAMFCSGASNLQELSETEIYEINPQTGLKL